MVRPGIPYLAESGLHVPTPQERSHARARWGLPDDAFVVTAIGRLSTEKRFDLYLEVCPLLKERMPAPRFMLLGGGKPEARSSLGLQYRPPPRVRDLATSR